ncbi:UNVERIFIED_ORG: hypothetical protein ABIB52_002975 [Arthrobacter sp. UYCu721]
MGRLLKEKSPTAVAGRGALRQTRRDSGQNRGDDDHEVDQLRAVGAGAGEAEGTHREGALAVVEQERQQDTAACAVEKPHVEDGDGERRRQADQAWPAKQDQRQVPQGNEGAENGCRQQRSAGRLKKREGAATEPGFLAQWSVQRLDQPDGLTRRPQVRKPGRPSARAMTIIAAARGLSAGIPCAESALTRKRATTPRKSRRSGQRMPKACGVLASQWNGA